jgi:hypothetical protein
MSRPVLQLVDGVLQVVEVPGGVVLDDEQVAALREDKEALTAVAELFGPVQVEQVAGAHVWPPKGGFVPAWRRVRGGKPLIVLRSEQVPVPTYPPAAPIPDDWRLVCAVCGGKNRCRPDHTVRLRQHGERLLRRTKSAKRRAEIEAALAQLPEDPLTSYGQKVETAPDAAHGQTEDVSDAYGTDGVPGRGRVPAAGSEGGEGGADTQCLLPREAAR